MTVNKNEIIFLIRAYNEAPRIAPVIESILNAGFSHILIVDDGSKDDTMEVLSRFPNLHTVHHPFNRGGGAALETGFEYIRRNGEEMGIKYVVTFDADGQHHVEDVPVFMEAFRKDSSLDLVLGSRFVVKTQTNVPFFRRLTLLGGQFFTLFISGIWLTDAHNGFRMLRLETVKKIHLTMDGMEYGSEFVDEIKRQKCHFIEVPVNVTYTDDTLAKGQHLGGIWRIVSKMIWKKYFN
ncbi:MAG: glycosyltransferase family 2 protein [Candidatus Gracilibacteria bacterium]|nr:glycosyltransferase family 2 protein [Candidatus Gracilibacteria bacterium]